MGFNCGIVGLPNVGKSTLFNALTAAHAESSNYPFCTIDPNIGVVAIPDLRLSALGAIYRPDKIVPTSIEFVDIAGLVRGASKGEGLGNQFLAHIREVDAIAHVVRCFDDPNVIHVDGSVDPKRDIEVVEAELILKDLETVERKFSDAQRRAKSGDKKTQMEADCYRRIKEQLLSGRLARYYRFSGGEEESWVRDMHLLTCKPVMYVCNVEEEHAATGNEYVRRVEEVVATEKANVVTVSAEVEAEIAELSAAEQQEFLESLGLRESGLSKVVREGYDILHLITFFTVNPKELHAWTVPKGATALQAAGRVHSDFERGFIRAEVMKYADVVSFGSEQTVKDRGLLAIEGREYRVQDGDVLYFRFHV